MAYVLGRRLRRLLLRVGNLRKTNKSGVESWSDNMPGIKESKQMKISRVHGIWVLRIQERHFYFPSLSELIHTVRKIVGM